VQAEWVAKIGNTTLYEKDFYLFVPKRDWESIQGLEQKEKVLWDFVKQEASYLYALQKGLDHSVVVHKKLKSRFSRLLVNEYYMRHFLGSVVPKEKLLFCQNNLKKQVLVKHILLQREENFENTNLLNSIKDSLLKGVDFSLLAQTHSQDPSVEKNNGVLGWVSLGETIPEFQDVAFRLCLGCVGIAETEFGVHLIQVDSTKNSRYASLGREEYQDYAFRFSTAYIKGSLKSLASQHDSLLIKESGVILNKGRLQEVVDLIGEAKKGKSRREVDVLSLLKGYNKIIGVYNNEFLSGPWFANKLKDAAYKNVFYSSVDEIYSGFVTVLLRDIAESRAKDLGLDLQHPFIQQYAVSKKSILEKAFMKDLIQNVVPPSKKEVEDYFLQSGSEQDLFVAYSSIEAVLLQKKQEEAKVLFFNDIKDPLNTTINTRWLQGDF
tara:strand:- start:369 stop:1676 length:1308 start_codon:yes stop_codon:yes gene_type:complete